jgi:hypothetical protein
MKLTDTQRRVLEVLRDGGTLHATSGAGWFAAELKPVDGWREVVRKPTLERLCTLGLIQMGEARAGRRGIPLTPYELTDAGREALAAERGD